MTTNDTLTAVPGIRVGQVTHIEGVTGCTVVLCPPGTVGGVDQRGGAPGTRETDLLRPMHLVERVDAIMLAGGSAYGLAAADGAMRYLEAQGVGYPVGEMVVPIVPAAILMDLWLGKRGVRPDAAMGQRACEAASDSPVSQGSVGAGTGCVIGGMAAGKGASTKGGLGSASVFIDEELVVAALVAVNSVGDVLDEDGQILAGIRNPEDPNTFVGALNLLRMQARNVQPTPPRENTVIGVVATNAALTKDQINKVAQMAQDGVARAINPAHTLFDGDTLFALATGAIPADVNVIGAFAAEAVARAIRNGVRAATTLDGVRAVGD
jgi:L-aminopeptidase/D-esterase-like protein